jgi:HK97 gp10 family phage protein
MQTEGLDELISQLEESGELLGDAADEILLEGARIYREAWISSARIAVKTNPSEMIASISASGKPRTVKGVRKISVYPMGKNDKGVRNAYIAFVHNYGSSRYAGSRFVETAEKNGTAQFEKAAEDIWNQKLQQKGLT